MLVINNRFNNYYTFYKVLIFILGFVALFSSEVLIKYTGNGLAQDIIIFVFPLIIFLLIYLFLLKKNYN
jgi:lipopolysaccharide export LptBFGC system permease protein LptF